MCMPTSLGCAEADCLPCRAVLQGAAEQDVDATVAFEFGDCHETQLQNVSTAEGEVAGAAPPSAGRDDGTVSPASTAAPTPLPAAGGTHKLPSCCLLILPSAMLGGLTFAGAGHSSDASTNCHLPGLSCGFCPPACTQAFDASHPTSQSPAIKKQQISKHARWVKLTSQTWWRAS